MQCECCEEYGPKIHPKYPLCSVCLDECIRTCDLCDKYDFHEDPQDPYDWVNGMCGDCDPSIVEDLDQLLLGSWANPPADLVSPEW